MGVVISMGVTCYSISYTFLSYGQPPILGRPDKGGFTVCLEMQGSSVPTISGVESFSGVESISGENNWMNTENTTDR